MREDRIMNLPFTSVKLIFTIAYLTGTGSRIEGYSLCCVSVHFTAKCFAWILSLQRLPFRHPGTGRPKP